MASTGHWRQLEIDIYGVALADWNRSEGPRLTQKECPHPPVNLQAISNGNHYSIGCQLCLGRWKAEKGIKEKIEHARKEFPQITL